MISLSPYRFNYANVVRLVNTSANAAFLGGAARQVYSTFQAAYDAANTLQGVLGSSNKVIIFADNTTAAAVGNLALAASYNQHVIIGGVCLTSSVVGTITGSSVFSVTLTCENCTIGNITAEAGITLTCENCTIGNTSTASTTGVSGAHAFTNCSDSTIGTVTGTSSAGNTGSVTFTNCKSLVVGNTTIANTSTTTSYNVGTLTMTNCQNIRMGSYTANGVYASSTGTNGGVNISNSNTSILFTGTVLIVGYTNTSQTASQVKVTQVLFENCVFTSAVYINARNGGADQVAGGYTDTLIVRNCRFHGQTRFHNNSTNQVTITGVHQIYDCFFNASFSNYHNKVTFPTFELVNIVHSGTQGELGIAALTSTTSSTTGVNPMLLRNIIVKSVNLSVLFFANASTPASIDDVIIDNVILLGSAAILSVLNAQGDCNFILSNVSANDKAIGNFGGVSVKRTVLRNSSIRKVSVLGEGLNSAFPWTIHNSYIQMRSDGLNHNFIAHNSTIDFTGSNNEVITISGTLNTCNLYKKVLMVNAATMNNSYAVDV